MNALRMLFALLLLAYPGEFRREYRSEIMADLEERHEPRLLLHAAWDLVVTAIGMRVEWLWRDLEYAVRMLRKTPVFTAVVVGTLALAIAGNAVVFSILDTVLLKPLPYANADRLGILSIIPNADSLGTNRLESLTMKDARRIFAASHAFGAMTTASFDNSRMRAGSNQRVVGRVSVSPNYFAVLGVRPELGIFFQKRGMATNQAVISDALWHSDFGAVPTILGRHIVLDRMQYTIVGVAPRGMVDPLPSTLLADDVWTNASKPAVASAQGVALSPAVFPIVSLRDGTNWNAARADISRINQNKAGPHAPGEPSNTYDVRSLSAAIFGSARRFLFVVFAAVSGVVLIACANVANLLVARAAARDGEFSVRSSLGATGRAIYAQVMCETLVLAFCGSVLGLLLAGAALPAALSAMPAFPRAPSTTLNLSVLLYVCGLTVAVTILAGLLPAIWRAAVSGGGFANERGVVRGSGVRATLVGAEIAIACTLLVCSGLLLRSFVTMTKVNVGFDSRNLYAAQFIEQTPGGELRNQHPMLARRIAQRIREIPGVQGASIAQMVPFSHAFSMRATICIAGRPASLSGPANLKNEVGINAVSPNYMRLMKIGLPRGRAFIGEDTTGPPVAIVDRAFVKRFFPRGNALGKRIGCVPAHAWRIVGIAADTRDSLTGASQPLVYVPFTDQPTPFFQIVVRTARGASPLAKDVGAIVRQLDPSLGTPPIVSLPDSMAQDTSRTRLSLLLLGALAVLALVLALAGVYSIVSYSVQRRYHEIGIRMALGARPVTILNRIVARALVQSAIGIGVGIVMSAFATRAIADQLFQTSPFDATAFAGTTLLLLSCSAFAAVVPALRIIRVDPAVTLRYE